jgi:putative glutamine amidotransferase
MSTTSALATWDSWIDTEATLLPESYTNRLIEAGSTPVLLVAGSNPEEVLDHLDGIVLVGGQDVDPQVYGAVPGAPTQIPDRRRDSFEAALVTAATRRDIPLLGICRGMQILNVVRGGTLHQHLPDVIHHERHSPGPGLYGDSTVTIQRGSTLARSLGRTTDVVACYHHQGIDHLGDGLVVVANADDGVVEAIEDPSLRFMIGVQWHPEVLGDAALFGSFISACVARQGH